MRQEPVALAPDMNSLVLIGTLAAFAYSVLVTISPEMVLLNRGTSTLKRRPLSSRWCCLASIGNTIQAPASDAMKLLLNLVPKSAIVVRNGKPGRFLPSR